MLFKLLCTAYIVAYMPINDAHLQILRRSCKKGAIFEVVPECWNCVFFLCLSMAYNVISCQKSAKTLKFWKSLILLCNLGFPAQKLPNITQKTGRFIAICPIFWIGMVYIMWYLVNPHVQRVQNMYGKGGRESSRPSYGRPKLTLISKEKKSPSARFQKLGRPKFWL